MSAHIIPNSKHKGEKILYQELPPTPSSSTLSCMFVPDQKAESKTPSLNHSQYGAMSLASTVNPNDENESLYLLWTHQLLKENTRDNDDDDCSSMESSVTGILHSQQTKWFSCLPFC